MDMNKTHFLAKEAREPRWRLIDAEGKVVGRLASEIADILRGKDQANFTRHIDSGDYVIVINADKIVFTGDKMEDKEYNWHTGYVGSLKTLTAKQVMAKDPSRVITHAVKGMLPKTKIARAQIKKLKVYVGKDHPHAAQLAGLGA